MSRVMYESHFGLRARPFSSAPDPDFYFESRAHQRALAHLRHGIAERDSFMVMTGDIGAGKTTLVQKLLRELDEHTLQVALLVSSQLDARQLLGATLAAFDMSADDDAASLDDLRGALQRAVHALVDGGRRALLVIDEAQNLQPDALALLTGFAAPDADGTLELQVLLVGQPELRERIAQASARHHRQTVVIHCHIGGLSEPETRAYIDHRLRHVGWSGSPRVVPAAYLRIHAHSDGVPRRINRLCDRLLLAAYLRTEAEITPRLVDQVNAELGDELGPGVPVLPAESALPDMAAPAATAPASAQAALPAHPTAAPPPLPLSASADAPTAPAASPALALPTPRNGAPRPVGAVLAGAFALVAVLALGAWWADRDRAHERPAAAPMEIAAQPPPAAGPRPAPPAGVDTASRPVADTPRSEPVPSGCPANVVALGLCTPSPSSPKPKE